MVSSEPRLVLASALCAGRIGWITLAGPFIHVSVYADRMTVRFFGMGERTISGRDISMVREGSPPEEFWYS